jgi:hypothetical protein
MTTNNESQELPERYVLGVDPEIVAAAEAFVDELRVGAPYRADILQRVIGQLLDGREPVKEAYSLQGAAIGIRRDIANGLERGWWSPALNSAWAIKADWCDDEADRLDAGVDVADWSYRLNEPEVRTEIGEIKYTLAKDFAETALNDALGYEEPEGLPLNQTARYRDKCNETAAKVIRELESKGGAQ